MVHAGTIADIPSLKIHLRFVYSTLFFSSCPLRSSPFACIVLVLVHGHLDPHGQVHVRLGDSHASAPTATQL